MKQLSEPAPRRRARRTRPDPVRRLESARALVGYGEQERWRVRLSAEVVVAESAAIARAVQRRLDAEASVSFALTGHDGASGADAHADAIRAWIAEIDAPLSARSGERLQDIARAHTNRGGSADVRIPARYIALAFGVLQDEIARVLAGAIADREELVETTRAWNKLLMTQLDAFLDVYNGLEGRLHWY